jgi:L-rhamnose mutarotase
MQRYCLALDLINTSNHIEEYEKYHKNIPEAITKSIKEAGITNLEIYRIGTRLFMILEAKDDFTFEKKALMDANNPEVQRWEELMWQFQKPLKEAKEGEKWIVLNKIFQL